jgi:class 3 adenylate cyclase
MGRSILEWGLLPHHTLQERKQVTVTNVCVLTILVITSLYLSVFVWLSIPRLIVINGAFLAAYGLVLWVNYSGRIALGKWLFFFFGTIHIAMTSVAFGPQTGFELFLIIVCNLPFLIWGRHQLVSIGVGLVWLLLTYIAVQVAYSVFPSVLLLSPIVVKLLYYITILSLLLWICASSAYHFFSLHRVEALILEERDRSEQLLLTILPQEIAERLKASPNVIADEFQQVSVLFSDLVGFTSLAASMSAEELVVILNEIFTAFDELTEQHGLEKIKTIGDAYMVVGGLPVPQPDHVERTAAMAKGMLAAVEDFNRRNGVALNIRIGIHCGPVVAGVIGKKKFSYDLWGDTVNTAARMESHGEPGRIHVSHAFVDALGETYAFEARGQIEIKGKGEMSTFFL